MTAARRQRKWRGPALAGLLFALALAGGLAVPSLKAATTEQVVLDPHTGLAVSGFDPVAYFTEARARPGLREFEYDLKGTTWRFCNEGNRAAFAANPKIYIPQFGGYDPVAVARGVATAGHPELWLIADRRLYLFYSDAARNAFAADPDGVLAAAAAQWPQLLRTLAP
jgi:YHS domain-containing protein